MRLSYIIFAVLGLMSIVAFCAFGIDKYKARQGGWRIPEKTLLLIAAVFWLLGWI